MLFSILWFDDYIWKTWIFDLKELKEKGSEYIVNIKSLLQIFINF